ncbi:MAG: 23S rRNA (guanosine(2251)-2'-O)-methyltransferase RlmB, partial [Candidatus Competibacteraceae bacterium]|nr:23S rRNA (guanosine(2251)-2'-O)-methyltransferase RlmB [Candidatus Competibacteraceae bacterium]
MTEQLIYGLHAIAAALDYEPEQVHELWIERQRRDRRIEAVLATATRLGLTVHRVDRGELDRVSGSARHQGVVARLAARQQKHGEDDLPALLAAVEGPLLLLVLDGVQDPHNL